MKSIRNKNYLFVLAIAAALFAGCKEQDELFRKYTVEDGKTYPGKASDVKVYSGKERVQICWDNTDPTVTHAFIFWNNYQDSLLVNIPEGTEKIEQWVNVPEGQYSFYIKTYDAKGNVSVPAEVFGRSIGSNYISSLTPRGIDFVTSTGGTNLTVQWFEADEEALYTDLIYTAVTEAGNVEKTIRIDPSEPVTVIDDYLLSRTFRYNTVYKPNKQTLDDFPTDFKVVTSYRIATLLDKSAGSVIGYSSVLDDPSCLAENIYDGIYDGSTYASDVVPAPHWITIDIGSEVTILSLALWSSNQIIKPFDPRAPSSIRWELSTDNVNWTGLGNVGYDASQRPCVYEVTNISARYVKLWSLNDGPTAQGLVIFGEIDVTGITNVEFSE